MLYLSDNDVTQLIDGDIEHVVELMRDMFLLIGKGDYVLGGSNGASHGMRISRGEGSDQRIFIAMPGYLGGSFNMAGVKWHAPNVPIAGNDSDSYFTMILNDVSNGKPIAMMCADTLTRYRTAAINALAAEVLCRNKPTKLAVVGPGRIMQLTVKYLLKKFPSIEEIKIKGRGRASTDKFIDAVGNAVHSTVCDSLKSAVLDSDIVIINTGFHFEQYGDMPIIRGAWMKPDSLFICSAFANFPDNVLIRDSIKVCDLYASYESYQEELGYPAYRAFGTIGNRFADLVVENKLRREDMIDLPEVFLNKAALEADDTRPIIFSSNGLALEDIALACSVYKRARDQHVGLEVE